MDNNNKKITKVLYVESESPNYRDIYANDVMAINMKDNTYKITFIDKFPYPANYQLHNLGVDNKITNEPGENYIFIPPAIEGFNINDTQATSRVKEVTITCTKDTIMALKRLIDAFIADDKSK